MKMGRINEVITGVNSKIENNIKELFDDNVIDGKFVFTLKNIISNINRVHVLQSQVKWHESRVVVDGTDKTIVDIKEQIATAEKLISFYNKVIDYVDSVDKNEDEQRRSDELSENIKEAINLMKLDIDEYNQLLSKTLWNVEIINETIDEILGTKFDFNRDSDEVPQMILPLNEFDDRDEGIIVDPNCEICNSPDRAEVEKIAIEEKGEIMSILNKLYFNNMVEYSPNDLIIHIDNHMDYSPRRGV